ncbi:tRNA pseudouridine(38-40) synthase TruA [Rivibacter subsaxonicus]|uniref:tRNA pseudouridine synthase A n=1 Tax=Rivibacter subsaxonicus TaxID=457575 RepID=A0A4Q7VPF4_9BURK|nr:tRNA pseudouridine(38-40) synthase TruA [Rivibacter subsaxonicus]RZT98124.1 tRNA pseudouridine38-40 synthase [Rivibacter subsaxonicus]
MRVALGIAYRGDGYNGWQSQRDGRTVQDALEAALAAFVAAPVRTVCAGRTDAGVHALNQVVHLDTAVEREAFSWVRGTNRYLPEDIAVQWAQAVPDDFHARNHARGRRYAYVLRESVARPALETGLVGWSFRPLDGEAMRAAALHLVGTHDFSALRSSECQAASPIKELRSVTITRRGAYWRFDFDGSAFLHHMIRNIMGCLVAIGQGRHPPGWMAEVIASRSRDAAAPTFSPAGLYFLGPYYDAALGIAEHTPAFDWLPA